MTDLDEFARAQELDDTKAALNRALRKLEKARVRTADLVDAVQTAVKDAVLTIDYPPIVPPERDRRRKSEEVAVAWWSDWQLGKTTASYDSDVCEERVHRYVDKVQAITDVQRADHPVKQVRVWVTGDMVEGEDIFASQPHLIDSSLYRQLVRASQVMVDGLRRLESYFERVQVDAVDGNHGWIGGGPRRGRHPETNMDRLLYWMVAEQLRAAGSNVEVNFPDPRGERSWYLVSHIGEYRCLLIHGDQLKGGGLGFPWYSATKKVSLWAQTIGGFHDAAMGHWHQHVSFPVGLAQVRCAGSTESDNQFALETLAAAGRPSQPLLFVRPDRGRVTAEYRVWLDS